MLGIVYAITAWRCYLHGRRFIVQTDHDPLKHFFSQEKLSPLQVRWLEKIITYDFSIAPIKGKANRVADALSRRSDHTGTDEMYKKELMSRFLREKFQINNISTILPNPDLVDSLKTGYGTDPEFRRIYARPKGSFSVRNGLLYYKERLCIPHIALRTEILHDFHAAASSGHLGSTKTKHRVQQHYHWKNLPKDINDYVAGCRVCQQTKARNQKPFGLLQPIEPPTTKWSVITMDFIGPLPKTKHGHTSILNVCDKLTKTLRVIPLPEHYDAKLIAQKFIAEIYRHHGLPTKIISDRDSIFLSKFWKTLFSLLGVKIAPSTAYHPQTDGQTEIVNRKIEEMIRAFVNYKKNNWDEHLVEFEVAYNSAVHSTTGYTPFFLNYGIHPRTIPAQLLVESPNPSVNEFLANIQEATRKAIANIQRKNEYMAKYANQKRLPHKFQPGDWVWLSTANLRLEDGSTTRKLHPKFCGPFKILTEITPVTFRLELSEPMKTRGIHNSFHVSLLRPFVPDKFQRDPLPEPAILLDNGEQEYEVEAILDDKRIRNKPHYLVKWKGYPDHENSWEPISHLANAKQALQEYLALRQRSP